MRIYLTATAFDLRPTCNSGLEAVPGCVFLQHLRQRQSNRCHSERMRARSHYRHLAPDYVDELRKFVEAETSEKPPYSRDATVVPRGLLNCPLIAGLMMHGAEFPNFEYPIVIAFSQLTEQQRARAVELNGKRD